MTVEPVCFWNWRHFKGTLGLSFQVVKVLTSVKKQSCQADRGRAREKGELIKIHGDQPEVVVAKSTLSQKYTTITNRLSLVSWMTSQMQKNAGIVGWNFRRGSKSYLSTSFCPIRKGGCTPLPQIPRPSFTIKYYCVNRVCITSLFPYFQSSFLGIPSDVLGRLQQPHINLLKLELDYQTICSAMST